MKGSKFLSQDREKVMKAWLLTVVDEAGPGDLSDSSSNSSTSLCYISLSLEFGNIAQGWEPPIGVCILETAVPTWQSLPRPKYTKVGHSSPQQWSSEQSTIAYMGSQPPTR